METPKIYVAPFGNIESAEYHAERHNAVVVEDGVGFCVIYQTEEDAMSAVEKGLNVQQCDLGEKVKSEDL